MKIECNFIKIGTDFKSSPAGFIYISRIMEIHNYESVLYSTFSFLKKKKKSNVQLLSGFLVHPV